MDSTTPSPEILEAPPRKRRKRRKRIRNGRFYIFLLFLWLRVIDVTCLLWVYPRLSLTQQHQLFGPLVATAAWTTMLLLATWFRQNWARHLLIGSILIAVIWVFAKLPGLPDSFYPKRELLMILGFIGSYLPVALVLIASKNINKHTANKLQQAADAKGVL